MVESVIGWSFKTFEKTKYQQKHNCRYKIQIQIQKRQTVQIKIVTGEKVWQNLSYNKIWQPTTNNNKQITYKQNQTKKQNKLKIKIQKKTEKVVSRPRPQAGSYHRHNTSQFQPSIHLTEKILGGCNITSRN